MQRIISILMQACRKGLFTIILVGLVSLSGLAIASQPSYAATPSVEPSKVENRDEAYKEAKTIVNDPKRGVEEEYEKNIEEYREEHPGEGGIVEEVKEAVTHVTGSK